MACPSCGANCPATDRHCFKCGALLHGPTAPAPPPVPSYGLAASHYGAPALGGATSAALAAGAMLQGHYRVEHVLGSGAFGRVYLARDTQDLAGAPVAIKELLDTSFATPEEKHEVIGWFKREVSTLLTLEHPGIPAIYSYWTAHPTSGPLYLVMEYIPGKTLEQVQRDAGGPIDWPAVAAWGVTLCDVLAYLHSQTPPFVFRDMKLPNVMLDDRTGRPVLIDFGITRQFAPGGGTAIGTWGYVPYEQIMGQAEPRSDLYALGATLHALLTGRHPNAEYARLTRGGRAVQDAMRGLFPPPSTVVPGIPGELDQILARATAFDKDDRYPDAAAMADALRRVLALAPTLKTIPSGGAPTMKATLPGALAAAAIPAASAPAIGALGALSVPLPPAPAPAPTTMGLNQGARAGRGRRATHPAVLALAAVGLIMGGIGGAVIAGHAFGPPARHDTAAALAITAAPSGTATTAPPSTATVPAPSRTATVPAPPLPRATPFSQVLAARATARPRATATRVVRYAHTYRSGRAKTGASGTHSQVQMVALYVDAVDQGFAFANLRGRPNTGSSIQGTLPQGTRIDAVAKSVTGADGRHWYRVAYGSRRGYVLGALLNRQQPTALVTLYVNGADYGYTGVIVRTAPNTNAASVVGIDNGARVRVVAQPLSGDNGENWYRTVYGNNVGYARAKLLSQQKPEPMTTLYVNAASYGYTGVVIRTQPSVNADSIGGLNNGALIYVVGNPVGGDNGENWYKALYDYKVGYVRAKLLSSAKPSS